jgi:hypothetical protein
VETPRSWCNGEFFTNNFYKKTAAKKIFKESAIKTVEKIYGSSTGFNRSSTFIPPAKIALQELLEVPQMNTLKMGLGLISLLVCVSLLLMGAAQDTKDTSQITRYGVTGCLQESREESRDVNKYQLIAENAKWDLKSDDVRLADHVGHKVKVNGVVSNQPFHGMKEDLKAEVGKNPTETGVLTVTNLEIVSDSCN